MDIESNPQEDQMSEMMLLMQMENQPSQSKSTTEPYFSMIGFSGDSECLPNPSSIEPKIAPFIPFPPQYSRPGDHHYDLRYSPANKNGNGNGNDYPILSYPANNNKGTMEAMREMIFKIASMQPVHIDPESVRPPKRRNVRISKDPQSIAARHRRERISERIRILQRLVPGGTKMDTASMLDEAIHYVKFLKTQLKSLEKPPVTAAGFPNMSSLGLQNHYYCYHPSGDN